MNRQLTTAIATDDNGYTLAQELVKYGFINEVNKNLPSHGIRIY